MNTSLVLKSEERYPGNVYEPCHIRRVFFDVDFVKEVMFASLIRQYHKEGTEARAIIPNAGSLSEQIRVV